ncbi:MAG: glutathione S-transferase [Candidatus Marinimicrobia bacterium]|nr:glutathione S-transferase [Candidatus Neomarinimicrobiota bacterium]
MKIPILYSFRRCPYAMRARMALAYSKITYEHREILLSNRPDSLYEISPKGTVPVLQLSDGIIIDESIDVMKWCLDINDPNDWYKEQCIEQDNLIINNDTNFKYWLDRYKYHIRYEEQSFEEYQNQVKKIFNEYNLRLDKQSFLMGDKISLSDIALMPFVRQAAHVDLDWFKKNFLSLSQWLEKFKVSPLFTSIMKKYEIWEENNQGVLIEW